MDFLLEYLKIMKIINTIIFESGTINPTQTITINTEILTESEIQAPFFSIEINEEQKAQIFASDNTKIELIFSSGVISLFIKNIFNNGVWSASGFAELYAGYYSPALFYIQENKLFFSILFYGVGPISSLE